MIKLTEDQYEQICEYAKMYSKSPCNNCIIQCAPTYCTAKNRHDANLKNKFPYTEELIHTNQDVWSLVIEMSEAIKKENKLKELQKELTKLKKHINSTKRRMLRG